MPIPYYNLDDRDFEDLVSDMLSRIPGHTPEWTNPRLGDPGRTLIELFAWLADTLLYRANLIPERQRLAFLRLLNIPMRPAIPATGLVLLEMDNEGITKPVSVPLYTSVKGPAEFETCGEIMVLPLKGEIYIKRIPTDEELDSLSDVIAGLESVYNVSTGMPYISTPLFREAQAKKSGIDFVRDSVDSCLWIALLAAKAENIPQIRNALKRDETGAKLLNVGLVPSLEIPSFDEEIGVPGSVRNVWDWEITSSRLESNGEPEYISLDVVLDTTDGFGKQGVVRLILPDSDDIGVPENNVNKEVNAGVGNRPPRIDDAGTASRLVAWIRLRPIHYSNSQAFSWAGINAVEIDQRKSLYNVVVGMSNGMTDQSIQLQVQSVDPETLILQVEEPEQGFITWQRIDDLAVASRDDAVYHLDPEAGVVTFGDGVRGRAPSSGMRIRVAEMRYGGGLIGNLPPGNLNAIAQRNLKVRQPVETSGGVDAETLDKAEQRIPGFLRNGDRAVTKEDYKRLAINTPAVELGRVEILPKFKPQQRRHDVPGIVSVMVLPKAATRTPPNPRADRITLERVHAYLDARRPLATELYVISVEYIPIGLSVAVTVRDGHTRDQVLKDVRDALRDYLWPLTPGGGDGEGWILGQAVSSQELEVAVARVRGVRTVTGINLFQQKNSQWERTEPDQKSGSPNISLELWQLPELLKTIVVEDEYQAPTDISGAGGAGADRPVPIPVVPEVC